MTEHEPPTGHVGIIGRRSFVTAASLGILSLYGLWSVYGAAPGLGLGQGGDHVDADHGGSPDAHRHGGEATAGGHGEHGAPGGDVQAFKAEAEAYIDRYSLPDGSFRPPAAPVASETMTDMPRAAMGMGNTSGTGHAGHSGMSMPAAPAPAHGEGEPPVDVYLLVQQWMFEPSVLHLAAGVPYRFRMLALDVSHGASFQLGFGSRLVRLRPNTPTDLLVSFERPQEVLLYCTVYCGLGHDEMHARIVVT